ncbi:MAG: type II toxin-antitoxin system RelE/ParE family toxin [Verrucomicrobiia bacterium]
MTFAFHPEAKTEFYAAIDYYETVDVALGLDFSIEVFSTIQNIVDYPGAWPVLEDNVRRCLVHRFPYGVLYSIGQDEIFILAVMHLHRDPGYWKSRV